MIELHVVAYCKCRHSVRSHNTKGAVCEHGGQCINGCQGYVFDGYQEGYS